MQRVHVYDESGNTQYMLDEKPTPPGRKRQRANCYTEEAQARYQTRTKRRTGIIQSMAQLKLTTKDDVYVEFHQNETKKTTSYTTDLRILLKKKTERMMQPITLSPLSINTFIPPSPLRSLEIPDLNLLTPPPMISMITQQFSQASSTTATQPTAINQDLSSLPSNNEEETQTIDKFLMENSPSTTTHTTAPTALDENTCQMCEGKNDTETDLESPWIGCSYRKCKYWVHFICLGFECLDEDMDDFTDQFKFWCPTHKKAKVTKCKKRLIK